MTPLEKIMCDDNKRRRDYMCKDRPTNTAFNLLKFIGVVLSGAVVGFLLSGKAGADDLSLITDLLPEGDGLVIGNVGNDYVILQKIGDQTVGNVGDKRVYIHETEAGDWKMTTGHIGDDDINIQEWDWETDDEG